jgi:hypothetical protein
LTPTDTHPRAERTETRRANHLRHTVSGLRERRRDVQRGSERDGRLHRAGIAWWWTHGHVGTHCTCGGSLLEEGASAPARPPWVRRVRGEYAKGGILQESGPPRLSLRLRRPGHRSPVGAASRAREPPSWCRREDLNENDRAPR